MSSPDEKYDLAEGTVMLSGTEALARLPLEQRQRDARAGLNTGAFICGYRGSPPVDVEALEEVVLRLGALVEAHPEVVEVDLNPVIVSADGASVVDARMRVEPPPPRPPWPSLGR